MNLILIKMFATALALAQVTTRPESLKIEFDPVNDQAEVVQLLKDGCAHMRKAFDIEDLNLDTLIDTAMSDPQTVAGEIRAFRGINFDELGIAYKQFCGNGQVENSPFDMKPVIEFYNSVASNLPDHNRLKNLKLPPAEVSERVTTALRRYDLEPLRHHPAHLLSGGQKQLLALSGVLVMAPRYIVFDEPTTLLDLRNRRRFAQAIHDLPQTAIVVSHDLELLRDFERVLVFDEGRVVLDDVPATALDTYERSMA